MAMRRDHKGIHSSSWKPHFILLGYGLVGFIQLLHICGSLTCGIVNIADLDGDNECDGVHFFLYNVHTMKNKKTH